MLASRRIVNAVSPQVASRAIVVAGVRQATANTVRNRLSSRGLQHATAQTDRVIAHYSVSLELAE